METINRVLLSISINWGRSILYMYIHISVQYTLQICTLWYESTSIHVHYMALTVMDFSNNDIQN